MTLRKFERKVALVKKINDLRTVLNILWFDDPSLYHQTTRSLRREYRMLKRKSKGKYMGGIKNE